MCGCGSLDCAVLSSNAKKRESVFRVFGWTRSAKSAFERDVLDGVKRPQSFYVAKEHFAPGDRIVRGAGAARLPAEFGVGVASRGWRPGPGAGAYSPGAVPAATPQTADRSVSAAAAAVLDDLDNSAALQDSASATSSASSARSALESAAAEIAQLRRAIAAVTERAERAEAAPAWVRVGVRNSSRRTTRLVAPCSRRRRSCRPPTSPACAASLSA
jgi:hypothetical protein